MPSFLISLALLSAFSPFTVARVQDDSQENLETALVATRLKFQKNAEGNFQFPLRWNEEKRGQIVSLMSRPIALQDGIEVRELRSSVWRGKTRPDATLMEAVLRDHPDLGAWRLEKDEDGWAIYLHTDLPTDLRPAALKRWIFIMGEEADQMEKRISGKDDTF